MLLPSFGSRVPEMAGSGPGAFKGLSDEDAVILSPVHPTSQSL